MANTVPVADDVATIVDEDAALITTALTAFGTEDVDSMKPSGSWSMVTELSASEPSRSVRLTVMVAVALLDSASLLSMEI